MPTPSDECRTTKLVRFGSYRVDRCSCGAIHVAAGPVTLHMDEGAFRQFAETLAAGSEQLELLRKPHLSVVVDGGRAE